MKKFIYIYIYRERERERERKRERELKITKPMSTQPVSFFNLQEFMKLGLSSPKDVLCQVWL